MGHKDRPRHTQIRPRRQSSNKLRSPPPISVEPRGLPIAGSVVYRNALPSRLATQTRQWRLSLRVLGTSIKPGSGSGGKVNAGDESALASGKEEQEVFLQTWKLARFTILNLCDVSASKERVMADMADRGNRVCKYRPRRRFNFTYLQNVTMSVSQQAFASRIPSQKVSPGLCQFQKRDYTY